MSRDFMETLCSGLSWGAAPCPLLGGAVLGGLSVGEDGPSSEAVLPEKRPRGNWDDNQDPGPEERAILARSPGARPCHCVKTQVARVADEAWRPVEDVARNAARLSR